MSPFNLKGKLEDGDFDAGDNERVVGSSRLNGHENNHGRMELSPNRLATNYPTDPNVGPNGNVTPEKQKRFQRLIQEAALEGMGNQGTLPSQVSVERDSSEFF